MVIHNQGKQALKRIRRKLGLPVNREPLPSPMMILLWCKPARRVDSETINQNPSYWEKFINGNTSDNHNQSQ